MDDMQFNLHTSDLHPILDILRHFHEGYASHFRTNTWSVATQSLQYFQGKFLGPVFIIVTFLLLFLP
jgi:hypothetical protein